jgi:hypothetical protein
MGILRVLLLLIFAAFLAGCAANASLLQAQNNVSTTIAQPDRPLTTKVKSQAQKSKPPAPKPDLASTTSQINDPSLPALASTTSRVNDPSPTLGGTGTRPILGSPEWQKEQAEDARKEQNIKRVIEGICRGC